jgi:hypothetical protein
MSQQRSVLRIPAGQPGDPGLMVRKVAPFMVQTIGGLVPPPRGTATFGMPGFRPSAGPDRIRA